MKAIAQSALERKHGLAHSVAGMMLKKAGSKSLAELFPDQNKKAEAAPEVQAVAAAPAA